MTVVQLIHDVVVMLISGGTALGGILLGHYVRRDEARASRDQGRLVADQQTARLPKQ